LTPLILAPALAAAAPATAKTCPGRHLATVEPDGSISAGSRQAVVDAANSGAALRVGWALGPRDAPVLVHWQDARFITVFGGEVFTQVGDIHEQGGVRTPPHITLPKTWSLWAASIGTNGKLVGRMSTGEASEDTVVSYWCLSAEGAAAK
jgi:hypothetical protein